MRIRQGFGLFNLSGLSTMRQLKNKLRRSNMTAKEARSTQKQLCVLYGKVQVRPLRNPELPVAHLGKVNHAMACCADATLGESTRVPSALHTTVLLLVSLEALSNAI